MIAFIKKLFCRHKEIVFMRNIYGDEINWSGGRSWWKCKYCDKCIVKGHLEND